MQDAQALTLEDAEHLGRRLLEILLVLLAREVQQLENRSVPPSRFGDLGAV